jgi:putative transposase
MIKERQGNLSIAKKCKLLSVARSSCYYKGKGESAENLELMKKIDEIYLQHPFYGSRQMMRHLMREGYVASRHRVRRLMHIMGICAVYQKPNTSKKNQEHKIYSYLLKGRKIESSNDVWCADITYIPVKKGHMYLVAIMDWASKKVLSWRLSNTMDTSFCVEALQEALELYGKPNIFNTDQGSQFTSHDFTDVLKKNEIDISMDGKGRWIDNVFIERLWRSLKYECVYMQEFEFVIQLKTAIASWFEFYNVRRPHSIFDGLTPDEVYHKENSFPQKEQKICLQLNF